MKIHREGRLLISLAAMACATGVILVAAGVFPVAMRILTIVLFILLLFILFFFRHPRRNIAKRDNNLLYAPADGKVVVVEATHEHEYFNARRIQVSIFMSPLDVHVNRVPLSGTITYYKYHPGKYLVAWHSKASVKNEHASFVLKTGEIEVLMRQIAGFVARRIVSYIDKGQHVVQGEELGFIKFGSRFDLLLPLDAEVFVERGQKVRGNETVIARLSRS